MKTRSKALYQFLLESGAINGIKEDIAEAKRLYRQRYLMQWRQNQSDLCKEIRFSITKRDYYAIKVRAISQRLKPASYAKQIVIASLSNTPVIPDRKTVEEVRQSIGIAYSLFLQKNKFGNISEWDVEQHLIRAERLLAEYLKNPC